VIIAQKKILIKIRLKRDALNRRGSRAFLNPIEREGGYLSIASRKRTSTVAAPRSPQNHRKFGDVFPASQIILYMTLFRG